MTNNLLITLLLFVVYNVHGQQILNHDPQKIIDPAGLLKILTPPTEVEGSADMFDTWQHGDLYLSNSKVASGVIFNYDILNHMLSVLVEGKEYSLNPVAVDSIQLKSSAQTLVNSTVLKELTSDLLLLKLYESQYLILYRKTTVEVIKPNYNELLNVGSRNFQIDQDYFYLLWEKVKGRFTELQGKKKELKEWDHGDQVITFVKNQHLDLKNETDLVQVVQYYEQLAF